MIYKTIPQYPAYEVSQCGTVVRRGSTHKEVKQSFQMIKGKSTGYLYCTLLWNTDNTYIFPMKRIAVHRLVAFAWLNLPLNDKYVWINHKDGVKSNNNTDNLEWSTIAQNIQHAWDTGLHKSVKGEAHWRYGKKVSIETKLKMKQAKAGKLHPKFKGYYFVNFKRYESANKAGIELNIPPKTIINRCKSHNTEYWKLNGWYFLPV